VNIVVLTGAAGTIGSALRMAWRGHFPHLRLIDIQELKPEREGEETRVVDLADFQATRLAVEGADAVVHLAGIPQEDTFQRLLEANIATTYNVFEASRQAGVRRVVFASTYHVTGFYATTEHIGPCDPVRPDSIYAVTKVFGEALGRLYADKWGLEVVCLRIGAFDERPGGADVLPMWLSPGDGIRLFTRALAAPDVGFIVAYGTSRGPGMWRTNEGAALLGYEPEDDVDPNLRRALASEPNSASEVQGGRYAARDYWVEP
jgi:uronate dehydrogenase